MPQRVGCLKDLAPKQWRPVTSTDEEKAMVMDADKVRAEGHPTEVHVGSYFQQTYHSSSTEEADINSSVDAMTFWVADNMIIPQLSFFVCTQLRFPIHSTNMVGCTSGRTTHTRTHQTSQTTATPNTSDSRRLQYPPDRLRRSTQST